MPKQTQYEPKQTQTKPMLARHAVWRACPPSVWRVKGKIMLNLTISGRSEPFAYYAGEIEDAKAAYLRDTINKMASGCIASQTPTAAGK